MKESLEIFFERFISSDKFPSVPIGADQPIKSNHENFHLDQHKSHHKSWYPQTKFQYSIDYSNKY